MTNTNQTPLHCELLQQRRAEIIAEVARQGIIDDAHTLCGIIDLDTLDELMASLLATYPASTPALHTVAAKSIPLRSLLARFADAGFGCETASGGELAIALAAGFPADKIVYDSPAKTATDIQELLELGISFNIDNFQELARVDALIRPEHTSVIGIRINPQTGAGSIAAMSTSTTTSKFGIGLTDSREELIAAFLARPWLTQLHVHSGSQGLRLEHMGEGVRAVLDLAEEIEARAGEQRVRRIDVGGGLPVNFASDEVAPGFDAHRAAIELAAPALLSGAYEIVTEFGRALTAKAGITVSRVEYDKVTGGRPIAITHAGVQVATRTVFMPESWPLRVEVYDAQGERRSADVTAQNVAGPACFSGDMLAVGRELPRIHAGDLVVLPDTGGYYFSVHFSYNALPRPAVYAVQRDGSGSCTWSLVRRAQTVADIVADSGEAELRPIIA